MQRSRGAARIAVGLRGGRPSVRQLHQSGSAKVFLPRPGTDGAIFLNTSGGLTGGDQLGYALDLMPGLRFCATTQTAERAYASQGPEACVDVRLQVGAGSHLDWLPQETLLYEHSAIRRETRVDLGDGASVLLCEMIVLGRHAMGENPVDLRLHDRRMVYRGERCVWADSLAINAEALARRDGSAVMAQARCHAVVALIGRGAEDAAGPLRPHLMAEGCDAALSGWNGRLILRLTSRDSWPMKRQLARILTQLRDRPLPRAWQMNGDIA